MFEAVELGHRIGAERYARELPPLRADLIAAQLQLIRTRPFSVVIILAGMDGAGKGDSVNVLNEWLDPRHVQTYAPAESLARDGDRPPMWRYWGALPAKGEIAIFFDDLYSGPIRQRVYGHVGNSELDQALERNLRFEKMLVAEGVLVLKIWLHLSRKDQKKRFCQLEQAAATRWRVTAEDWHNHEHYQDFHRIAERALRQTSTAEAPWTLIEGSDRHYRELTLGQTLLQALRQRLEAGEARHVVNVTVPPRLPRLDDRNLLRALDLGRDLAKADYDRQLAHWQGRLSRLSRKKGFARLSLVVVFEGNDAAGKGGAIRRVTRALDARRYRVVPVGAPTDEEAARPYLWRFWRQLPTRGRLVLFDRSWYGRVLVERVEGLCEPVDWLRAYGEINDFEEQLVRHQCLVVKFWLAIDADEQLRRFRQREAVPFKQFKITAEDWRNRDRWPLYEEAVCDMVERTSSDIAPWVLVEANSKRYARIKILKTLCQRIAAALRQQRTPEAPARWSS
ncbi:polyphosphate:AMP phosphotransferase [Desulfuromonas thiophila]|mgnify:CR=1 FL=1|uniref:polyphosphate:AMP phosphotransferase n=1 Tax=Desulfuromonas thiophila TaxID=57664 RepID=UPI0024A7AC98|nr:polyphosphate:AMP phosphotransferase [Desulfuromonas thiophila]